VCQAWAPRSNGSMIAETGWAVSDEAQAGCSQSQQRASGITGGFLACRLSRHGRSGTRVRTTGGPRATSRSGRSRGASLPPFTFRPVRELCRNPIGKLGSGVVDFRALNRPPTGRRQANVRSSASDVPRTKGRPWRHQPQSSDAPSPIPRRLLLPSTFRRPLSRVTGRVWQRPPPWTLLKGSVA
jgi:hypothetical protein